MIFDSPTTKFEMYETLNQIFYFYRIRREGWENMELKPLELEPMTFEAKNISQLSDMAEQIVAVDKEREVLKLKTSLKSDIAVKTALKSKKQIEFDSALTNVQNTYDKAKNDYCEWAEKRGMGTSDIVVKQLNEYQIQLTNEVNLLTAKYSAEIESLQGEITDLTERLQQADAYFDQVYSLAKMVKLSELQANQEKTEREVFKYNNALDEKIQRYDNDIIQAKANLEVKYLQIDENLISKDQLIERGYYQDAINCVCAYYDTLAPIDAYRDLVDEVKLSIYLDEFYQNVVYGYRCKAESQL